MNKKLTITLPLLALLVFGMAAQTSAQTRVPGVQAEDYLIYSLTSYWSSNNASLTVPAYLLSVNNTQWYNVTVSYVQGTNVTARTTQHFVNNTDDNRLVTLDVDSGSMYFMYGFQGFFDANLGVGDLLRPSGNDSVTINQTVSRDYASGKRDTNVATFSYPVTDYTNNSLGTTTVTYYIDKATGVLVERKDYTEFPDQNGSEVWVLKETNLWMIGEAATQQLPLPMPILIAIVAVIIVAIVAVVSMKFYRGRKNRRKKLRR